MAKNNTQFDLSLFSKNADGSYSKNSTFIQPRNIKLKDLSKELFIENKVPIHQGNIPLPLKDASVIPKGDYSAPKTLRKITLNLFGEPMPKQSVRGYADGSFTTSKTGKRIYNIFHYQPAEMVKREKDYQRQIKEQLPKDFVMFTEKVYVTKMHFIFSPLKAFSKIKGRMDAIRDGEIFYKATRPDLPDNLKKLVNDSMSGLVYKDDGLICKEDNIAKYYGTGGMIIIELAGY